MEKNENKIYCRIVYMMYIDGVGEKNVEGSLKFYESSVYEEKTAAMVVAKLNKENKNLRSYYVLEPVEVKQTEKDENNTDGKALEN